MKKDVLTRPFTPEQIKQRPGQHGKILSYVDVAAVTERLNEAFEFLWTFEIVRHDVQDREVIVLGKLTADGVTKMAFGGATITVDNQGKVVSLADDLKAAASDALKKSASLLGVALDIYAGQAAGTPETSRRGPGPSPRAHPMPVGDRLTSRQLAAIHGACRRQGVSKEELGSLIEQRTGKGRPEHLTRAEASDIISSLSASSFNGNGASP
jgi:hypothetical protein